MTPVARIVGTALALIAGAGVVRLSDGQLLAQTSRNGLVRLSWRAVGERIEKCRALDEAELAALPRHMRRPEICEGTLAPFDLAVRVDGAEVITRRMRPEGAREDRPTYVFEEIRLPPGPHELEVVFASAEVEATTPPLRLETTVVVPPRGVVLVTRDEERGDLEVRERLRQP